MGKGLAWNGVSPSSTPVVFLPLFIANSWCQATISGTPSATCIGTPDPAYEVIGPQVFRFEYYYLLTNGSFSDTPWDTSAGHTNVSGMRDVAAIIADIAVIDPKSKVLVTVSQMEQLAGTNGQTSVLPDYSIGMTPGQLLAQWRTAINDNADPNGIRLPRPGISGIRVYERFFYLTH
jgi:hypothetical protein